MQTDAFCFDPSINRHDAIERNYMAAKKTESAAAPVLLNADGQPYTFTQAMNRLETIVANLNNPSLDLEQAMADFKEGLALQQYCQGQLDRFQKEMNVLVENSSAPANDRAGSGSGESYAG